MVKDIHDNHETVSNIFGPFLRDLLLKIREIYENGLTWPVFYHYQDASPAPSCIVLH